MANLSIGFIVLRHVNSKITNEYWKHSYKCIRKFYPENDIIIIDDNSNKNFLNCENIELYKTKIIQSEYPKRGELLPYIYYLQNKLFDIAVILHDSVFVNKYLDFNVDKYKIIWDFGWSKNTLGNISDQTRMIKIFNDNELLKFYEDKSLWRGCFGAMSVIRYDYLEYINSKYNLNKLIHLVLNRSNRISFERVIGCLLQKEAPLKTLKNEIGDIGRCKISGKRAKYNEIDKYSHLPLIKVWTGR